MTPTGKRNAVIAVIILLLLWWYLRRQAQGLPMATGNPVIMPDYRSLVSRIVTTTTPQADNSTYDPQAAAAARAQALATTAAMAAAGLAHMPSVLPAGLSPVGGRDPSIVER
jgi:hypothetical protein